MPTRRRFLSIAGAGAAAAVAPGLTRTAQSQTIHATARILLGFPPGGPVDIIGRLLARGMTDYAPTIIVENRPGGGGRTALDNLKTSPADGSVFAITPQSMIVIFPHIYKSLKYKPLEDFIAVTTVATFPLVVVIGPMVPKEVTTLADFIGWCRAHPDKATYGSPSAGAVPHFTGVMLARAAGVALLHIPYQGVVPAMQNLLGGEIAANVTVLPAAIPHVQSGAIRALATTGPQRSPLLPDVPTLAEAGYPGLESVEWFGVFVPAKTPMDIVNKLNASVHAVLATESVKDGLRKLSLEVGGNTPEEFTRMIKTATERWGPIVAASGFTPQD